MRAGRRAARTWLPSRASEWPCRDSACSIRRLPSCESVSRRGCSKPETNARRQSPAGAFRNNRSTACPLERERFGNQGPFGGTVQISQTRAASQQLCWIGSPSGSPPCADFARVDCATTVPLARFQTIVRHCDLPQRAPAIVRINTKDRTRITAVHREREHGLLGRTSAILQR
jgi:hypothetical protein